MQSAQHSLFLQILFSDAMAYRGDIVGCRVLFEEESFGVIPVSFTLNGREIGRAKLAMKEWPLIYPFVGMAYQGISTLFSVSF